MVAAAVAAAAVCGGDGSGGSGSGERLHSDVSRGGGVHGLKKFESKERES